MNQLDSALYDVRHYIKNEELAAAFDGMATLIREANQFNIEAMCAVGDVEENELDIGELGYDDYEIVTGTYVDADGVEYTYEELDERKERVQGIIDDLEYRISENQFAGSREPRLEKMKEYLQQLEDAEYEEDEIYWNTVWNYRGSVDTDLAQRLGFGVIKLNHDIPGTRYYEGDEFMFLQGCGMDLSPEHVAYQALEFGYVEPGYVSKFRQPDYFTHVVGQEIFNEVCKELGITECVQTAQEEAERRMAEFNERIDAISEARQNGELDPLLAGLAAISAYAKSQE